MSAKLTELPNIGKVIAADLISIGILSAYDLRSRVPLEVFKELKVVMGRRHDPCVYYTLLAADHFLKTGEALTWWRFTEEGKKDLRFGIRAEK